ncbi:MAG: protein translocase subunit SecF, partial [Streptosporangiaceae bacterium]
VDFVGRRKIFYAASGLILLICVVALLLRGLDLSVDFKGGSVFQFSAPSATATQIESVVTKVDPGATPSATETHPPGKPPLWSVQTSQVSFAQGSRIQDAIASNVGIRAVAVSRTFVGPTWGSQISEKALEGLIAFLIAIVIYLSIAFEWKMASAALVALAHDIVITIGVYAITGFQVSPATVIGLLTILGYSLYDTVVVFDKVRENTAGLTGTRKLTYSSAANLALNQTLVRSINTSLIALLPVAAILITSVTLLGNGELKDLSLVLVVGMLSGTYSSICIATPGLADLKEREPQYKQLTAQIALRAAGGRASVRKAKAGAGVRGAGQATGSGGTVALEAQDADDAEDTGDAEGGAAQGILTGPDAEKAPGDTLADGEAGEQVTAGRPAAAAHGGSSGLPRQAGRQQSRRGGSARRGPAGKKKRR